MGSAEDIFERFKRDGEKPFLAHASFSVTIGRMASVG